MPHIKTNEAIRRNAIFSLRRRPANVRTKRLGRQNAAANAVAREFCKGDDGRERLAVPPVPIVRVEVAEVVLPAKTMDDGAKVQVAYCGRLLQLNCSVPE